MPFGTLVATSLSLLYPLRFISALSVRLLLFTVKDARLNFSCSLCWSCNVLCRSIFYRLQLRRLYASSLLQKYPSYIVLDAILHGCGSYPPHCIQNLVYFTSICRLWLWLTLLRPSRIYRRMVKVLIGSEAAWKSPVSNAMLIMLDTGLVYTLFFVSSTSFTYTPCTQLTCL
jgi:hypothetical protein